MLTSCYRVRRLLCRCCDALTCTDTAIYGRLWRDYIWYIGYMGTLFPLALDKWNPFTLLCIMNSQYSFRPLGQFSSQTAHPTCNCYTIPNV
ncbi:hypothetical protein CYLTODRAFT_156718 [Cylindrobasidium torrendii FP15055 ss-10]|uniref:Uncharacterized protein n=1 Tax=Cylindrobasidium torrendii FP15055 ss-10 TaxID=1314674 RepID=A0A0D7BL69_9AGAR|nr:hypothetical protein CYLTODRAFT_156718 [Cylindrobasidium torrendii FP15055 ss-10]